MTPGFSIHALAGLGALVFFAGAVDALAGGGGLITLPAYLAFGLSPALLLGTNKLSSSIGTSAAVARYWRELRLPLAPFAPVALAALAGSLAGALLALLLDPCWLRPLVLLALPVLAAASFIRPRWGEEDETAGLTKRQLTVRGSATGFGVGAYDGFFGPGAGTFYAIGLARLCGYGLLGATARAKLLNLASNVAALAAFLCMGRVDLRIGLLMGAANAAGNIAGSHLGLKRGAAGIRPALALVSAGLFAKIALDLLRK